jgi:hypothetical protein
MNAISPALSLSVLVPVYNEEHLVAVSLRRLRMLMDRPMLDHDSTGVEKAQAAGT